jgi:signal transduction histidine kinase
VQDAGLAALLLIGTGAISSAFADPARCVLIGVCVVAVAVRRRWSVMALAAASLAAVGQMTLAVAPVPADLAVPIILYTIAVRRRPKVSLALLGAAVAMTTAWSAYVALDGKTDGWTYEGRPFGVGGQERPPEGVGPPQGSAPDGPGQGGQEAAALGPTDWGGIPILGSLLVAAWATGWGRRAYLSELRVKARDLEREREQQAALAAAAERARITRELHDVVAHGLAVIVMQAQGGAAAFAKRPADTLAALDTIVATGRASLADIRHVLSASGPADDPALGLAQLNRLIDQVRRAGTPVELRVDGPARPLPTGVDGAAYRIVQEALTNTMKHAGPGACAEVVVSYGTAGLTIVVSDDGTGGSAAGGPGNGLRGMRERAALLGGEVTAGRGPDGGYVVRAHIALEAGKTA